MTTPNPAPIAPQRDWPSTLVAGAVAGLAVAAGAWWTGWHIAGPSSVPWNSIPAWKLGIEWLASLGGWPLHVPGVAAPWPVLSEHLAPTVAQRIDAIGWTSVAVGWAAGCWTGWAAGKPPAAEVHESGRRTTRSASPVARELAQEGKPDGVRLHPDLVISQARERQHMLALGQSGAGKTQILLPVMQQAIGRGDRVLLFDYKGDLTERLPGALLAPWDNRSLAWDIARDCQTKQAARALAEALVESSKDPMWANGARQILVAMVVSLQRERGQDWTWSDLAAIAPAKIEKLREMVEKYNPEGMAAVEEKNKTAEGLRITLSTYLSPIFDLADAWGRHPAESRLSLVEWITNPDCGQKTLILQGNLEMPSLQRACLQGVFRVLLSMVGSPRFPANDHKIWLFLDEFLQIGKIDQLLPLLEVARGKGVRIVLAAQDISRVRDVYGRDQAAALSGVIGTMIMGRTIGESAQWCSDLLGEREVRRYQSSSSAPAWSNSQPGQQTSSYQLDRAPCMRADEFGSLGQVQVGLRRQPASRAVLYAGGAWAAVLDWPRVELLTTRPAHQPADWTLPGWPRTADQIAAAIIDDDAQPATAAEDPGPDLRDAAPASPAPAITAPTQPAAAQQWWESPHSLGIPTPAGDAADGPDAGEDGETPGDMAADHGMMHTLEEVAAPLMGHDLAGLGGHGLEVLEVLDMAAPDLSPAAMPLPQTQQRRRLRVKRAFPEPEQQEQEP